MGVIVLGATIDVQVGSREQQHEGIALDMQRLSRLTSAIERGCTLGAAYSDREIHANPVPITPARR